MPEPRIFTLTGMKNIGTGESSAMTLPSIEPTLERDEVLTVIEAAPITALLKRVLPRLLLTGPEGYELEKDIVELLKRLDADER